MAVRSVKRSQKQEWHSSCLIVVTLEGKSCAVLFTVLLLAGLSQKAREDLDVLCACHPV